MTRRRPRKKQPEVSDYRHDEKRPNNPPAGLMADYPIKAAGPPRREYAYNPHLDPQLQFDSQSVRQRAEELLAEIAATDDLEAAKAKARELQRMQEPWLQWAGKAEHTSFEVENVPLYIHERISTQAIVRAVRREEVQKGLFGDPEQPLHEAVEAYLHPMDWTNRLILGDSLVVMNSLLERERMAGQVQMIYIDPPYGIGYNSNFQPRVDKRDVRDGADEDLTREPEQIKAYRDTWTLGIHSYLTYLRDRLLLARELLHERGSVFVQIGDENVHLVRCLMDEVFGHANAVATVTFQKGGALEAKFLNSPTDYLLWYAKDKQQAKYRPLYWSKETSPDLLRQYDHVELADSTRLRKGAVDDDPGMVGGVERSIARRFKAGALTSFNLAYDYEFEGRTYRQRYQTPAEGVRRLEAARRLYAPGATLWYVRYIDDFPLTALNNVWLDTSSSFARKIYAVQTTTKVVERCLLMTTDPGDLVLDPTCGSGTTAYVAEQWGRRWITCDTSRVAVFLARQRLLTARFEYYELAAEEQGVAGGFRYKTVPHITLKSIANNPELDPDKVEARREGIRKEHPDASEQEIERLLREQNEEIIRASADQEVLYNQPYVDRSKVRVSGPFTVEAIPPPSLEAMEETPIGGEPEVEEEEATAPVTPTEHVETLIEQLRKDGVLFPDNKKMEFASVTGCGSGVIHAEGAPTNGEANGLKRMAISFGPLYGPVTTRQVEDGLREANIGGYDGIIFCGFAFDAEAQAAIAADPHRRVRAFMAHIRPDMLMTDETGQSLLKTTATSQLFTVFGEPEISLTQNDDGEYVVELKGVDVYDPLNGTITSDRGDRVAAWFVDTDYDGRTFCVCQAFFPDKSAWEKLGRALKGYLDPEKFEMLSGTTSLPFTPGKHKRVAVKVIDRRGNEVMVVRPL